MKRNYNMKNGTQVAQLWNEFFQWFFGLEQLKWFWADFSSVVEPEVDLPEDYSICVCLSNETQLLNVFSMIFRKTKKYFWRIPAYKSLFELPPWKIRSTFINMERLIINHLETLFRTIQISWFCTRRKRNVTRKMSLPMFLCSKNTISTSDFGPKAKVRSVLVHWAIGPLKSS